MSYRRNPYYGWANSSGIDVVDNIPLGGVRETLFFRADANKEGLNPGATSRIITSMQLEHTLFGRRIKSSLKEALRDVESLNDNDFFVC